MLAAAGGLAIGAAIGYLMRLAGYLLRDPLLANTASLATPFLAYLAGEEAHVSGVLAVVIAGLMAGHDAAGRRSPGPAACRPAPSGSSSSSCSRAWCSC